ncbi:uncharacterized protein LOC115919530 [Strongylocentrotus purpuratus]|uniref:Uncharacterized protein n=1 Tax=Strongylocentrotus purpuratus TaxID=7668 RepID=A0A7M7N1Z0_STRPU|nr:uncharacterized protein LOC115919530 [Strongylocentrotus purpuratus]
MEIISHTLPRSAHGITTDDTVICRTFPKRRSLNTARSFDRQYCNTSLPLSLESSSSSSPLVKRTESTKYSDGLFRGCFSKLNRRNIVMRNQQPMRSSSFDTEGKPSSHPQSYRIKSRRGAVTSDLSPASSDTSVEESHDHQDCTSKVTEMVTTSAPCSPQMTLINPRRPKSAHEADMSNHFHSVSEVGPTLASFAAVHLQDFIEASAQGLDTDSTSEQGNKLLIYLSSFLHFGVTLIEV